MRTSIYRGVKHGVYFALKKKDYTSILSRIKVSNAVLATLANQNNELELGRRSRSQTKLAILIRKLSRGILSAIGDVIACKFSPPQYIGLQMDPRNRVVAPNDGEHFSAKSLELTLILGTHYPNDCQRWDRRCVRLNDNINTILILTSKPSTPSNQTATSRSKHRVKWSSIVTIQSKQVMSLVSPSGKSPGMKLFFPTGQ